MMKLLQKLTEKQRKFRQTAKSIGRSSILFGSIIGTLIASVPFLFYLYESVPSTPVWDTFLFTYYSKLWDDANYAMWVLTQKAIPLLLLTIWFFTCRHWWYHVLIVPIAMYIYQIFGMFNAEFDYFDQFQLLDLVPVMAIVIPSIYLIRAKMLDKIVNVDKTMEDLEKEFMLKPKDFVGKLKQYF